MMKTQTSVKTKLMPSRDPEARLASRSRAQIARRLESQEERKLEPFDFSSTLARFRRRLEARRVSGARKRLEDKY